MTSVQIAIPEILAWNYADFQLITIRGFYVFPLGSPIISRAVPPFPYMISDNICTIMLKVNYLYLFSLAASCNQRDEHWKYQEFENFSHAYNRFHHILISEGIS